ncbi:hypothetical protein NDI56_06815 [Haloarcula sp. S1CR25-12]|uniref:Hsp20/alpha crystallin family protein n=1 Tax=Haloarcula saliterrae TaxID=2950534 RepID=A0ABU2FBK4_9EURY|nr:hypothetical protein [Haloarcula sp. S1CR25-12]MDS0259101.1 hypothetical protein [Haloarcula sp. S1CR25-12]
MDTAHDAAELHVSRTDHDDGWTVAVDLHPVNDEAVTAEVVDDTAIIALDTPMVRTEFDVALPDSGGTASLHNGVLVVEGPALNTSAPGR